MHAPVSGFIVIAIKSDQRSKIWLDFDREIEEKISKEMISEIERVAPPSISNGVLSFGLNYKFWRSKKFSKEFPRPAEWESLVKKNKRPMETSDIINSLWK
jgi:hypothetical protein